jgi:hypothetical protein
MMLAGSTRRLNNDGMGNLLAISRSENSKRNNKKLDI